MTDFPRSLIEFQQRFADEEACAQNLAAACWPDGFVCPGCGGGKAWRLQTKARPGPMSAPAAGARPRSPPGPAGTLMHHSKLPLAAWFWAAYLMATHSNGAGACRNRCGPAFPNPFAAIIRTMPEETPLAPLLRIGRTPGSGTTRDKRGAHTRRRAGLHPVVV